MGRLDDKVAIITGGAGGIGRAMGKAFIDEGAKVVLVDMKEGALRKAATSMKAPERVIHVTADVRDAASTRTYIERAKEAFGGFDILCANAGIEGSVKPIHEQTLEEFDHVWHVNVRGVFLGIKHGVPHLIERGGGSIIITSSVAGLVGAAGLSPYCTSKHAVVGLMKTAAQEYGPAGVRVNTINPGPIDNRMMRSIEDQMAPGEGESVKQAYSEQIPMRRYGTERDVAQLAAFLASDDSTY